MRPISAIERFFERLFERPSARLFRARLHPVQVLRRMEQAMERERRVAGGRTSVPDRFTVRLHPKDVAGLAPLDGSAPDGLPVELATGALTFARRHGYALMARPRVAIIPDPAVHPGEVGVEVRFSDPSSGPDMDELDAALLRTRVFEAPVGRGPRATLAVTDPGGSDRRIVAGSGALTIGRAETNRLVLADARVSRHHARLVARDGLLVLTDLGSTNGTRVNGLAVREIPVGVGDEIRIGATTIVVEAVDERAVDKRASAVGRGDERASAVGRGDEPPASGGQS